MYDLQSTSDQPEHTILRRWKRFLRSLNLRFNQLSAKHGYSPHFQLHDTLQLFFNNSTVAQCWVYVEPEGVLGDLQRDAIRALVNRTRRSVLIVSGPPAADQALRLVYYSTRLNGAALAEVQWAESSIGQLGLAKRQASSSYGRIAVAKGNSVSSWSPRLQRAYEAAERVPRSHFDWVWLAVLALSLLVVGATFRYMNPEPTGEIWSARVAA